MIGRGGLWGRKEADDIQRLRAHLFEAAEKPGDQRKKNVTPSFLPDRIARNSRGSAAVEI